MINLSSQKAWRVGLVGLIALALTFTYFLRRDIYALNRNVRLVYMRLLRYRELSLHRGCAYRIQFGKEKYQISFLHPGQGKDWQDYEKFSYVRDVEVVSPGFTVIFDNGRLASYYIGEEREKLKPSLILYFFHQKKPERRKGIMFAEAGWLKAF